MTQKAGAIGNGCSGFSFFRKEYAMVMNAYVVYKYKNSIRIKYGMVTLGGTFDPVDGETWMTHIPTKVMQKMYNKVVVPEVDMIPEAISMLWGQNCKPCKDEDKLDKLETATKALTNSNSIVLQKLTRIEQRLDALEGKRSKSTYGDKTFVENAIPDSKETYKRSGTDGFKTCPYCGGNWNMTHDRMMKFYDGPIKIRCGKCNKIFTVASFDKQKCEYVYITDEG